MMEARERAEWNQTSALMAAVCNIMRDPKKGKPVTPEMFNPYFVKKKKKKRVDIPNAPIEVLRDIFCKEKK